MHRESYVGKTILVTGGAGFIGSHLVDGLMANNARQVIIVDSLFLGSEDNIQSAVAKGAVFYKEDIEYKENLEYIFDKHNVDIVFNLATKPLNYSFVNPGNAFTTNVNGVINLLELQRKGKFKSLCHFSTSEVYGSAIYEPMDEKHPKAPTTTYAAGKAAADIALESYVNMFDVDSFIVRPFNNYGPRQNFKGLLAGIIPITAWRIHHNIPPEINGKGNQRREFIHVSDTVDAVLKLFTVMPKGDSVNISTNNCYSVKALLSKIIDHYGYTGEVLAKEARGADVITHIASNAKVSKLIAYKLTPFDEGLEATLDWYKVKFENSK